MRAVDGLDLPGDRDRNPDAFAAWLQAAARAELAPNCDGSAGLADAGASLAAAFTAAIQVWQDFDDTAPLQPASGTGADIEDWLGAVRRERLRECSQRVAAARAQMAGSLRAGGPAGGDTADGVCLAVAQAQLREGASPPDAARAAIACLTARLVHARTLANGTVASAIKEAPPTM